MGWNSWNRGSIPGRGKMFITSVKRADRLSVPSFRLLSGYLSLFSRGKIVGSRSWPLIPI